MTFLTFLDLITSGLTYLTTTGLTSVIYVERTLEDLIELNPLSYPGAGQSGISVWLVPIPMTIDADDFITYSVRIYLAQQIKEDFSDRFTAFSNCIQLVKMLIQYIPDNIPGVMFPINITPILLFDATVDGLYVELSIKTTIECLV